MIKLCLTEAYLASANALPKSSRYILDWEELGAVHCYKQTDYP